MTTAEMRIPDRPPVVGQAASTLRTATALFAAACAVKTIMFITFIEVGHNAQYRVANMNNYDPDLLEYVPTYFEFAEILAILCYASSVLWFTLAARSVARGGPYSLSGPVCATVNAVFGLALQPLVWLSLPDDGDALGQLVLDRMAEETPWWAHTGDALAVIAFILAVDAIVKLCTNDARWFRSSAT